MNKYEQGIQIVDMPEEKVSKYEVAYKAVAEAPEGKAVKLNREIFQIGSSGYQIRGFIGNFRLYCQKKHNLEIEGMSQNGSIFLKRK